MKYAYIYDIYIICLFIYAHIQVYCFGFQSNSILFISLFCSFLFFSPWPLRTFSGGFYMACTHHFIYCFLAIVFDYSLILWHHEMFHVHLIHLFFKMSLISVKGKQSVRETKTERHWRLVRRSLFHPSRARLKAGTRKFIQASHMAVTIPPLPSEMY